MNRPITSFAPLAGIALTCLITVTVVLLVSCVDNARYAVPPDATWKERAEYCFFFQVDPKGNYNNNVGWSDTKPVVEPTEAGFILTAVDVRASLNNVSTGRHGDAEDDYFREDVLWTTDGDGLVNVERRCANG